MGPSHHPSAVTPVRAATLVAALNLIAKAVLLLITLRVALDPTWGNLEGKAPGTRAVTYPLLAFVVPVAFFVRRRSGEYPWAADLMLTVSGFSDVLGNRLDLYDQVLWFDDVMHFAITGLLAAAILLLSGADAAPLRRRLELAIAAGLTASLAWELWEYFAFMTRSTEMVSAYADTLGDLALGWGGAVAAAVLVGVAHRPGVRRSGAAVRAAPRELPRERVAGSP